MKFRLLFILFLFSATALKAQKKISKDELVGDAYLKTEQYYNALTYYTLAYEKSPSYGLAGKLAGLCREMRLYKEAIGWYEKLIENTYPDPKVVYFHGICLRNIGRYQQAKNMLEKYIETDSVYEKEAALMITSCDSALAWSNRKESKKQNVRIENLSAVNSEGSDIGAAFYESGMVFSSSREKVRIEEKSGRTGEDLYDFYYSYKKGRNWEKPRSFSAALNKQGSQGTSTFTRDFRTIYFSKSSELNNSRSLLRLYKASWEDTHWGNIEKFLLNDSSFSCTHPSVSADGRIFIFASDMPGGYGGTDLYISFQVDSGWTIPRNLGEKINTPFNELSPYFHEDGILFFASDGHYGLGGYDIFSIQLNETEWVDLKNRKELNSFADDFSFVLGYDKRKGYFSSNREGGKGKEDIYSVTIDLFK